MEPAIRKIFLESETIAVVGCSSNPEKPAHYVPKYLQQNGYKIIPINTTAEEILGEKCYKKISDVKEKVDIIGIFRPSKECLEVVNDSLKIKPKLIWMQSGIVNEDVKKLAEEQGIQVVMDRCMMVEHRKLVVGK